MPPGSFEERKEVRRTQGQGCPFFCFVFFRQVKKMKRYIKRAELADFDLAWKTKSFTLNKLWLELIPALSLKGIRHLVADGDKGFCLQAGLADKNSGKLGQADIIPYIVRKKGATIDNRPF